MISFAGLHSCAFVLLCSFAVSRSLAFALALAVASALSLAVARAFSLVRFLPVTQLKKMCEDSIELQQTNKKYEMVCTDQKCENSPVQLRCVNELLPNKCCIYMLLGLHSLCLGNALKIARTAGALQLLGFDLIYISAAHPRPGLLARGF